MTSHLTVVDVCDARCPAAAVVAVSDPEGRELKFCGHDFGKHELALTLQGWVIVEDKREALVKRPADVQGGIA
jgi:hypothetical protein